MQLNSAFDGGEDVLCRGAGDGSSACGRARLGLDRRVEAKYVPFRGSSTAMDYSKRQKRILRELLGEAHKRDLSRALQRLLLQFGRWESGEIDCFELNERVHRYHQDDARAIWVRYCTGSLPTLTLAIAVHSGLMTLTEIPEEFREHVAVTMGAFPAPQSESDQLTP